MNYFQHVQELWPQIMEQILYRTCLIEQPFLSKITTGCLRNFSFLEVYMYLNFNCTCKDTNFKRSRVVALKPFSFELKETIVHKCSKKNIFEILEELMLYFISIRAWVENFHKKAVSKMRNYF